VAHRLLVQRRSARRPVRPATAACPVDLPSSAIQLRSTRQRPRAASVCRPRPRRSAAPRSVRGRTRRSSHARSCHVPRRRSGKGISSAGCCRTTPSRPAAGPKASPPPVDELCMPCAGGVPHEPSSRPPPHPARSRREPAAGPPCRHSTLAAGPLRSNGSRARSHRAPYDPAPAQAVLNTMVRFELMTRGTRHCRLVRVPTGLRRPCASRRKIVLWTMPQYRPGPKVPSSP
jgi:hypothetical protein